MRKERATATWRARPLTTALVETILTDSRGAKVRVVDFTPRFERFERTFRPPQLFRIFYQQQTHPLIIRQKHDAYMIMIPSSSNAITPPVLAPSNGRSREEGPSRRTQ